MEYIQSNSALHLENKQTTKNRSRNWCYTLIEDEVNIEEIKSFLRMDFENREPKQIFLDKDNTYVRYKIILGYREVADDDVKYNHRHGLLQMTYNQDGSQGLAVTRTRARRLIADALNINHDKMEAALSYVQAMQSTKLNAINYCFKADPKTGLHQGTGVKEEYTTLIKILKAEALPISQENLQRAALKIGMPISKIKTIRNNLHVIKTIADLMEEEVNNSRETDYKTTSTSQKRSRDDDNTSNEHSEVYRSCPKCRKLELRSPPTIDLIPKASDFGLYVRSIEDAIERQNLLENYKEMIMDLEYELNQKEIIDVVEKTWDDLTEDHSPKDHMGNRIWQ